MNASRAIFWSFVHVLSASGTTLAFPIPPQTLWDLTLEAERVVVARVETVKIDESGDLAVLRVIETWKGPFTEFIRVRFSSRMICPAPPRYVEGREVLAFLKASDEVADSFTTVGLSYGSLYPAVEDRQAFWQLVHRLGSADDSTSFTMKKEWHVEAASRRATRWHGLYGLESSADAVHSFYDRPQEGSQHLGALLSAEEISAIAEGIPERALGRRHSSYGSRAPSRFPERGARYHCRGAGRRNSPPHPPALLDRTDDDSRVGAIR